MFFEWAKQSSFIWVYQHDADGKVSRTHCHILVINSERDSEGLKKLVSWKNLQIEKGNGGSSFKSYRKIYDFGHEGEWYQFLAYASEGKLEPMYANGANAIAIASLSRDNWIEPKKADANATANVIVSKSVSKMTLFQIARMAQSAYMDETDLEELQEEDQDKVINLTKLIKIVIRLLKANKILAHRRTVANIIQDIRADLSPNRFIREVLSMI